MKKDLGKCCVKGCTRDIAIAKHQLCRPHLQMYYRGIDPTHHIIRNRKEFKPYVGEKK